MVASLQELLTVYLVPIALAVPVGILLMLLVARRDDRMPPPPRTAPPPAQAPSPYAPTASSPAAPAARQTTGASAAVPGTGSPWAPPKPAAAAPAGVTVLVTDDSAVVRAKLRKLFEAAGYKVELAANGEEALEAIGRRAPSVLVTDLEMPEMDGFELIAAVQGSLETEDLPIIAITGHDELQARVRDMQGLFGLFKKPWNDRELLKRVAAVAGVRGAAAAG